MLLLLLLLLVPTFADSAISATRLTTDPHW
jgi:hypothetical protein